MNVAKEKGAGPISLTDACARSSGALPTSPYHHIGPVLPGRAWASPARPSLLVPDDQKLRRAPGLAPTFARCIKQSAGPISPALRRPRRFRHIERRPVIYSVFRLGLSSTPRHEVWAARRGLLRHIKPRRAPPLRQIKAQSWQLLMIWATAADTSNTCSKTRATPPISRAKCCIGDVALLV